MNNPFADSAAAAAAATNKKFDAELQKLVPTWDAVRKALPDPKDQEQLAALEQIVKASTDHNQQVASLITNVSKVADVVVKLARAMP